MITSLRQDGDTGTVHVEDVYATSIDDLWDAVTKPERLARWLAKVDGDLRVGGEFRATFTSSWDGQGRVDECDAPNRLVVTTWEEGREPNEIVVTLTAEGASTRLVIEELGFSLEEYADHGAGWQVHAEDLHAYLDGRPTSDWSARWRELRPQF